MNVFVRQSAMVGGCLLFSALMLHADPSPKWKVELGLIQGRASFFTNGHPFPIRGACGWYGVPASPYGVTAFRSYGQKDLAGDLKSNENQPLLVLAGFWLSHVRHGFDYQDGARLAVQQSNIEDWVTSNRTNRRILAWALGNEMETYIKDPAQLEGLMAALQKAAMAVKRLDPNRPVTTVFAGVNSNVLGAFKRAGLMETLDFLCVNSYGGVEGVGPRLRQMGWTKPFLITETGALGPWERPKTPWGAPLEETSTEKTDGLRGRWTRGIEEQRTNGCLGGFFFKWSAKQEVTRSWFGMTLADGTRLAQAALLQELFTGKAPDREAPRVKSLSPRFAKVKPGETLECEIAVEGPTGEPVEMKVLLFLESASQGLGNDRERATAEGTAETLRMRDGHVSVRAPEKPGKYRVFFEIRDTHGMGATANIPLLVE